MTDSLYGLTDAQSLCLLQLARAVVARDGAVLSQWYHPHWDSHETTFLNPIAHLTLLPVIDQESYRVSVYGNPLDAVVPCEIVLTAEIGSVVVAVDIVTDAVDDERVTLQLIDVVVG